MCFLVFLQETKILFSRYQNLHKTEYAQAWFASIIISFSDQSSIKLFSIQNCIPTTV